MQRIRFTHLIALSLGLLSIHTQAAIKEDQPLRVGVTAGPHAQVVEIAKKVAERDGLKIKIVEFSDYIQPNAALEAGDIDVNSFQHQPYLDNTNKDRGYHLVSIAKTVLFPMGAYSQKYKKLEDLPVGARIALPNDPTNGGRFLLLLEKKGLIKLKPNVGFKAAPIDIIENPKKLKFTELDAAQLTKVLDSVDVAGINTNFAIAAGFLPTRDAIALEPNESPYSNVLVVRAADKDNPIVKKFLKAYQSDEVKAFINKEYKGSVLPSW